MADGYRLSAVSSQLRQVRSLQEMRTIRIPIIRVIREIRDNPRFAAYTPRGNAHKAFIPLIHAICIHINMHKNLYTNTTKIFGMRCWSWFERYQREMPWRDTDDPYRIWVSEVMLQQTQVKKVIDYYEKFIARFPSVRDLAAAPLQDVLKVWEGLGITRGRGISIKRHRLS